MSISDGASPRSLAAPASVISLREVKTQCLNCSVRELCLPVGVDREGLHQIDALVAERLHLKKGDTLYRAGDAFAALHAIRVGSCKTTVLGANGHEQVAGYHMMGDIVGMDGIATERHDGEAVTVTPKFVHCHLIAWKISLAR